MKEYKDLRKQHNLPAQGVICEMIALAVHKDYGRRGIGGILTKLLMQNAKKQGFRISFAECSSAFSTRALEKYGAKTEHSIEYKTWNLKGTFPFANAVEPHTKINLVVFRLKE